jgi:plasmid stabilization system protein ParE
MKSSVLALGRTSSQALTHASNRFADFPRMGTIVDKDYRRALVRRFPYAVFYQHVESTLTVYAVMHTSRDPKNWRERLS